jgi:hypothetical protein
VREFLREKGAVFWVFIFPVLMTFALGIAFRNTAPEKTFVAIESVVSESDPVVIDVMHGLAQSPEISATILRADEAQKALRSGKVSIIVKLSSSLSTKVRVQVALNFT